MSLFNRAMLDQRSLHGRVGCFLSPTHSTHAEPEIPHQGAVRDAQGEGTHAIGDIALVGTAARF
jgi:hypothetical protein